MADSQWRSDLDLQVQLESLVKRGYQRNETLHEMKKDLPHYTLGCIKIWTVDYNTLT